MLDKSHIKHLFFTTVVLNRSHLQVKKKTASELLSGIAYDHITIKWLTLQFQSFLPHCANPYSVTSSPCGLPLLNISWDCLLAIWYKIWYLMASNLTLYFTFTILIFVLELT